MFIHFCKEKRGGWSFGYTFHGASSRKQSTVESSLAL